MVVVTTGETYVLYEDLRLQPGSFNKRINTVLSTAFARESIKVYDTVLYALLKPT